MTSGLTIVQTPPATIVSLNRDFYNLQTPCSFNYHTRIAGPGGVYTAINPACNAGDDNLVFSPDVGWDCSLTTLEGFHLASPYSGTRQGRIGVYCATWSPGQQLPRFTMRDVMIGQGSGPAFHHVNNPSLNVNGGLYCATFDNISAKGGIIFEDSGDSISLSGLVSSGSGIGVFSKLVPGATGPFLINPNITNAGGAILHTRGHRFSLINPNIEHAAGVPLAPYYCVVGVIGLYDKIVGGRIQDGLISAFGDSAASSLITLYNTAGFVIDGVTLTADNAGTCGVYIGPGCVGTTIVNLKHNAAVVPIIDQGVGTRILNPPILI